MDEFMLPCLTKKFLGYDCFGCGMQRATALLFRGEFIAAFKMYPAIYSLLLFALFLILNIFFKFKQAERIKFFLIILNIAIIVINYAMKLIIH
jgi:hypothetical protein